MRNGRPGTVGLLAALLLTGCGGGLEQASEPDRESPQLQQALTGCKPEIEDTLAQFEEDAPPLDQVIAIDVDGRTIVVTTPDPGGEIASALALSAAQCILDKTGAPTSIGANMRSTTAVMGRQDSEYNGITVQWSYAAGMDANGYQATFDEAAGE